MESGQQPHRGESGRAVFLWHLPCPAVGRPGVCTGDRPFAPSLHRVEPTLFVQGPKACVVLGQAGVPTSGPEAFPPALALSRQRWPFPHLCSEPATTGATGVMGGGSLPGPQPPTPWHHQGSKAEGDLMAFQVTNDLESSKVKGKGQPSAMRLRDVGSGSRNGLQKEQMLSKLSPFPSMHPFLPPSLHPSFLHSFTRWLELPSSAPVWAQNTPGLSHGTTQQGPLCPGGKGAPLPPVK